jgi:hypothetical protein
MNKPGETSMKQSILSLLCVALSFCSAGMAAASGEPLAHANGLVIQPPAGFAPARTERGFHLEESGSLRNPRRIDIELSSVSPAPGLARKRWGSEQMVYRIDQSEGGSGGTEYRLWAAKSSEPYWIVVTATVQHEGGAPAFTETWNLLELACIQEKQK